MVFNFYSSSNEYFIDRSINEVEKSLQKNKLIIFCFTEFNWIKNSKRNAHRIFFLVSSLCTIFWFHVSQNSKQTKCMQYTEILMSRYHWNVCACSHYWKIMKCKQLNFWIRIWGHARKFEVQRGFLSCSQNEKKNKYCWYPPAVHYLKIFQSKSFISNNSYWWNNI